MSYRRAVVVSSLLALIACAGESTGPQPPEQSQFLFDMPGGPTGMWSAIYTVSVDGTGLTRLTDTTHYAFYGAWSPDGSQIAFTSNRDSSYFELYVMRWDGANQTALTHAANAPGMSLMMGSWSSHNTLAFLLEPRNRGRGDIATISATGGLLSRLTTDTANLVGQSWSPDGQRIAFTKTMPPLGNSGIVVTDADGSNMILVPRPSDAGDGGPAWSPDGSRIAFMRIAASGTGNGIYVVNADGSNPMLLVGTGTYDNTPSWSPDGREIAFISSRDGPGDIYVMNADGSNPRRVTRLGARMTNLHWRPR
jgi:TolB protein